VRLLGGDAASLQSFGESKARLPVPIGVQVRPSCVYLGP
jgi:hypothetical protein